jgi:hypothetical protein
MYDVIVESRCHVFVVLALLFTDLITEGSNFFLLLKDTFPQFPWRLIYIRVTTETSGFLQFKERSAQNQFVLACSCSLANVYILKGGRWIRSVCLKPGFFRVYKPRAQRSYYYKQSPTKHTCSRHEDSRCSTWRKAGLTCKYETNVRYTAGYFFVCTNLFVTYL